MKLIQSRDRMAELCRFLKSTVDGHVPRKRNSYRKHVGRKQEGRTRHVAFGPNMRRPNYPIPQSSQVVYIRYCTKKQRKWLKRSKERTRLSIKVHIARQKEGRSGIRKRIMPVGFRTRPGYRCSKARRKHIRKSTQSLNGHKQNKKQCTLPCKSEEKDRDMGAAKNTRCAPIRLPRTESETYNASTSCYTDDEDINGNSADTTKTAGKYTTTSDDTEVETDLESSNAGELEGGGRCAVSEIRANYLDVFPNLPQNEDNLISTSSFNDGRSTVCESRLDYLDVFPKSPQNECKPIASSSFDGEIRVFGETSPDDDSMPSQSSNSHEGKYAIGGDGFAYIDMSSPDISQDGARSTSSFSSPSDGFIYQSKAEIDEDGNMCGKDKRPVIEESIQSSTSSETDYSFYLDTDLEKFLSSSSSDEGLDPARNSPHVHDEFVDTEVDDPNNEDSFAVKSQLSFDAEDLQYVKYVRDERLSAVRDDETVDDVSINVEDESVDVEDETVEYIDIPVADTDDENTVNQRETKKPCPSTSHVESAVDVSAHASSGIRSTENADKPSPVEHPHPASPSQSYKEPSRATLSTKQSNSKQAVHSSVHISDRVKNSKKETGKKVLLSKLAKRIKSANLERRVPAHVKAAPLVDRCKSESAAKRFLHGVAIKNSRKEITSTPSNLLERKVDHCVYPKGLDRSTRDEATSGSNVNHEKVISAHCTDFPKELKKIRKKKRDFENETNTAIDRPVLTDVEMRKRPVQCDDESNSDSDDSPAGSDRSIVSNRLQSSPLPTYACSDKDTSCYSENGGYRKDIGPISRIDRRKQIPLSYTNKPTSDITRAGTFETAADADKHARSSHQHASPPKSLAEKTSCAKSDRLRKKSSKNLSGCRYGNPNQVSLMDISPRLSMYAPSTCVEVNKELSKQISSSRVSQTDYTRQSRPTMSKPRSALQLERVHDEELSKPGTQKHGVSPPNGGGFEKIENGRRKQLHQPKSRDQKAELGLDLGRDAGTRKKKSKTKQEKFVNVIDIAPKHETSDRPTTHVKQRKPTHGDHEPITKKNRKQPNAGKKSETTEDRFSSEQIVNVGP